MARRQLYDDVMDVALRATLKEYGFTRKTRRDYILERPDRVWIFELEMAPDPRPGFLATAAFHVPELDDTLEKYVPGIAAPAAPTHNRSNLEASIPQLMQIAAGHDFYTSRRGPASRDWSEAYHRAQSDPVMRYQENGYWVLPSYAYELGLSPEEKRRVLTKGIQEVGRFLDEQWRTFVWRWYRRCDDPFFIVDWIEKYEVDWTGWDITLATLCHMAGNDSKAAFYLQRRIDGACISYDEIHRQIYREKRGNLLQRIWSGGWSEDEVAAKARLLLEESEVLAEAAHKLADGLGIQLSRG